MDNQLTTGRINRDVHNSLVEDIDKYYELQKKKLAVSKASMNMSDLLSRLVKAGLLPQQQPTENVEVTAPPLTSTSQQVDSMDKHLPPAIRMNPALRIPDLHLKTAHLKQ